MLHSDGNVDVYKTGVVGVCVVLCCLAALRRADYTCPIECVKRSIVPD
jgi:hypothetical protein